VIDIFLERSFDLGSVIGVFIPADPLLYLPTRGSSVINGTLELYGLSLIHIYLRGVLDRQHMPPGKSRAGSQAPTFDDLRGRHPRVGEEPTRLQFATAVTTQPAQAYRLARNHPFEDRTPPLSRRTSPNDPSDHSISAPVLRLPGPTESYSRRVGQGISQIDAMANITCAHALVRRRGPIGSSK